MLAAVALIQLSAVQFTGTIMSTFWTFTFLGSAQLIYRRSALLFDPVLLQKLLQTHPGLELDHILADGFF